MLEIQLLATFGQGLDLTLVIAIETITAIVAVALLIIFGVSLLLRSNSVENIAR